MNCAFRNPANKRRPAGYILLEVMLATGIFAMAGVSLAIVLKDAITAGQQVESDTRIVWNLESRLNEAQIKRLEPGTETLPPDAEGITYEKEISKLNLKNEKDQSLVGIYDIKITATWKEQTRPVHMVAQTYVYQP